MKKLNIPVLAFLAYLAALLCLSIMMSSCSSAYEECAAYQTKVKEKHDGPRCPY